MSVVETKLNGSIAKPDGNGYANGHMNGNGIVNGNGVHAGKCNSSWISIHVMQVM